MWIWWTLEFKTKMTLWGVASQTHHHLHTPKFKSECATKEHWVTTKDTDLLQRNNGVCTKKNTDLQIKQWFAKRTLSYVLNKHCYKKRENKGQCRWQRMSCYKRTIICYKIQIWYKHSFAITL